MIVSARRAQEKLEGTRWGALCVATLAQAWEEEEEKEERRKAGEKAKRRGVDLPVCVCAARRVRTFRSTRKKAWDAHQHPRSLSGEPDSEK